MLLARATCASLLLPEVASNHCHEKDAPSVKANYESVWTKVVDLEGPAFTQLRGKRSTCEERANSLHLSTTNQSLTRSELEKAFEMMPLASTVQLRHVGPPSYLYALLMVPRIRVAL